MTPVKHRLGASTDGFFDSKGEVDLSAISSTFSMFIWGIVMAKAKTGLTASASKDKETVGVAFKKLLGMVALVTIASVAKLNAENNYLQDYFGATPATTESGRSLKAVKPNSYILSEPSAPVK